MIIGGVPPTTDDESPAPRSASRHAHDDDEDQDAKKIDFNEDSKNTPSKKMTSSLRPFTRTFGTALAGPTTGSAGSTDDGVNPGESRRRERIQADVARRARVIDGDTIEVGSVRIRLFGVDAPESAQSCLVGNRRWSCGEQATRALVGRIDGESVACEERGRDRYGRVVAVCGYGAQDVNAWLVREGSVTFMCRHGRYASRNTNRFAVPLRRYS